MTWDIIIILLKLLAELLRRYSNGFTQFFFTKGQDNSSNLFVASNLNSSSAEQVAHNFSIPALPVVSASQVIIFTFVIFSIGVCGFIFNRSHLILILISAELLLLAAFLNFSLSSYLLNDPKGQIYALMVLVVAAAESAIGLSLIVNLYSLKKDITINSIRFLKG